MSIETFLLEKYGPLLTIEQVAALLDRKPEGIRVTIQAHRGTLAQQLGAARIKIGRRTHFKTISIAKLLDGDRPNESSGNADKRGTT